MSVDLYRGKPISAVDIGVLFGSHRIEPRLMGGVVSGNPGCGERGPELIIPLISCRCSYCKSPKKDKHNNCKNCGAIG